MGLNSAQLKLNIKQIVASKQTVEDTVFSVIVHSLYNSR